MDLLRRIFVKDGRLHPIWRVVLYLVAYLALNLALSFGVNLCLQFLQLGTYTSGS